MLPDNSNRNKYFLDDLADTKNKGKTNSKTTSSNKKQFILPNIEISDEFGSS